MENVLEARPVWTADQGRYFVGRSPARETAKKPLADCAHSGTRKSSTDEDTREHQSPACRDGFRTIGDKVIPSRIQMRFGVDAS